jgi:glycosyltransferase involved in cell wall biosynthesis
VRIAILSSHPIQYQAPLFREMARRPGVDLMVYFFHEHGVRPTMDRTFGRVIQFDVPLLEGYQSTFLPNWSPRPSLSPMGLVNPGALTVVAGGRYDAVLLHGYASISSLMALLGPRRRTKVFMRGDSNSMRRIPLLLSIAKQPTLRALFTRIDHFLAAGQRNREFYRRYGVSDDRITIAPFSVDNDYFEARSRAARQDRRAARQQLGIPSDGPLFLFAGKLMPIKQPIELLAAFQQASGAGRAHLAYAGDGPLAEELGAAVRSSGLQESVHMLGFRNQSELPAIYGASDVLVVPSTMDAWGLVVNEAMACGTPCVVSDQVGAAPDLIGDPACIFRAGAVGELASILRRLIEDPAEIDGLRQRAVSRIDGWGLPNTVDATLSAMEAVVRR